MKAGLKTLYVDIYVKKSAAFYGNIEALTVFSQLSSNG
jgi:hypothetical protein